MANSLVPYSIAIGEENICFLNPHFKLITRENIKKFELMETNENFVNLFDYHVSNCEKDSFKKLRTYKFHSNYDN